MIKKKVIIEVPQILHERLKQTSTKLMTSQASVVRMGLLNYCDKILGKEEDIML